MCPVMEKVKRLMEAYWWEILTERETGSCSDGWGHPQQIFNPIFCWWVKLCYLPAIYQTMVEIIKIMVTSFNNSMHALLHSVLSTLQQATTNPHFHRRLLDTYGQVWVSLLWESLLLPPRSWCSQCPVCALQESISLVLCKIWQVYAGF